MQRFARLLSEEEKPITHDPLIHKGLQQQVDRVKDGHARLLAGERLVEAGSSADEICLVDVAGGSDGTWYWDRYPGLQGDVRGYIYKPFLKEIRFKLLQNSTASESASWLSRQQLSKSCHKLHVGPNPCTHSSAHPRIARRQHATDDEKWASLVATGPGWQLARQLNFDALFNGEEYLADHPDLVTDDWTQMARGFLGFIGGATSQERTHALYELETPLAEHAWARVEETVVKDAATVEQSNTYSRFTSCGVKDPPFKMSTCLLSTSRMPRLWTRMTRASSGVHHRGGIVAKGVEYELNVLILATGFLLALGENAAPAKLFGIPAAGCSGRYLKDKHGYLHGIATNSLPNVIYLGLGGRSGSLDLTVVFDLESRHIANVLK
ncbi:hypothetical protein COCC4DRAFT_77790 [Bipolaris maydis ATCC 48331]|uniref:Uncharacterized protein n=1 Tax=Cochliobolus heterostrophus (strain C4 / ATCC 48331 / race T) TaxID=665024 RepID=N4XD78_COCH4|nr:uncharacterized protein COCC4DRAFT_77790 [Bipolaris maydis ATCC 48331]ENI09670.1 hypothetical protein COCC4DRAFT_77790 [Bipolaris maydis ATCC 48331]